MKKILLVEDDEKVSMALSLRLNSLGYKVSLAREAQTALNKAANNSPDVILIDINLPGADGFSIASRLQKIRKTSVTPIIFITASKNIGFRERAEKLGAIAFLEKPFDTAKLIDAVELAHYSTIECSAKNLRE